MNLIIFQDLFDKYITSTLGFKGYTLFIINLTMFQRINLTINITCDLYQEIINELWFKIYLIINGILD